MKEPQKELPIDEAFVKNFKDKGGIFVYVEKRDDLPKVFQTMVSEAGEDTFVFTHNEHLDQRTSPIVLLPMTSSLLIFWPIANIW